MQRDFSQKGAGQMASDVKWIKITTDIFDDEKIILIESLPDAYAIITVWFKLLCLAGKQNNSGVFMMGRVAYTDKMLATIFRMKESTVTMALQTFEQFGMVEIIDGVITIPNWGKHQNLDQLESKKEYMRGYMREYREKQKALTAGKPNCKTNSKTNVSEADKEEDKDSDKEKDKDVLENTSQKRKRFVPPTIDEVKAYCDERQNNVDADRFIDYYTANGWLVGKNKMRDWKAAVRTWERNGYDGKQQSAGNSSFEVDDFFQAAVNRTYGGKKSTIPPRTAIERATVARMEENAQKAAKTAAEDAEVQRRAEELRKQLVGGG
jgi:predicted phage replisome organizer